MSNLYDKASLIVTPNAYKASKIYSAKPTDGSGDLVFSRASTATRRNSSGFWESVASGVPRLHYPVGGGCPSWLFEAEATNIITDSLAAAVDWTIYGGATITDESVSAPFDGVTSAIKVSTIILAHSGCYKGMSRASAVNANWVIVKKGTLDYCGLYDATGGVVAAWFNIANGTIGTIAGGYTATIADEGDGWYRCAISKTAGEAASIIEVMFTNTDNSSVGAIGDSYLCFAQNELGRTATSPIITAGSSVTRLADIINTPASQIGGYEGTFYFEGSFVGAVEGLVLYGTSIGTNSITIGRVGAGNILAAIYANSVYHSITGPVVAINTFCKMAVTYKSGVGFALFVNGTKYNGAALTFNQTLTNFLIGDSYSIGGRGMSCKPIQLYTTALSDTEAQELTTL